MPTTYGNDIVYCLKSHCGVRGYCRQKWVLQVQIICKFSNERTCKRNKDVQGLSCGFEVNLIISQLACKYQVGKCIQRIIVSSLILLCVPTSQYPPMNTIQVLSLQ